MFFLNQHSSEKGNRLNDRWQVRSWYLFLNLKPEA